MSNAQFNVQMFFAALDELRTTRKLSWKEVANEAGVSASTLTRIGQGKRPDVDGLAALAQWGSLDVNKFTGTAARKSSTSTMTEISALLRADSKLKGRDAEMLEAMIKSAYQTMRKRDDAEET